MRNKRLNQSGLRAMGLLFTAVMIFLLYRVNTTPRIAYVKSADLIYGYLGMKDAQKKQAAEEKKLMAEFDSLRISFEKELSSFTTSFATLDKNAQNRERQILQMREASLKQYSQGIRDKIKEKDTELTTGVLNQVNAFIETYAGLHGYDLVLGTTSSGNILFATNYMDITEEVLRELNHTYKPDMKN